MLFDSQTPQVTPVLLQIYKELKFWIPAWTVAWILFNGVQSLRGGLTGIKQIRENDLTHLHAEIVSMQGVMTQGFKDQTAAVVAGQKDASADVVNELRELRSDIRSIKA